MLSTACVGLIFGLSCPAAVTWEVLNEGETFRKNLNEVEWVGSGFVAVGKDAIVTSVDGLKWEVADLAGLVSDDYEEIAVGPGVLVIGDETAVYQSGGAWTQSVLPAGVSFISAAGDGSQFLALGDSGALYRSTDGLSWVEAGAAPGAAKGLAFGNGKWVSFDESSFYHSVDGSSWVTVDQAVSVNEAGETRYLPDVNEVDFSGGLFVATGIKDDEFFWNTYATSSDGVSWALADAPASGSSSGSSSGGFSLGTGVGGGGDYGPSLVINDVHLDASGKALVIHSENVWINSFESSSDYYYFEYADTASSPSGRVIVVGNEGLVMTSGNTPSEPSGWREVGFNDYIPVDTASDGETVIGVWQSYDRVGESLWSGDQVALKTEDGIDWEPLVFPAGGGLTRYSVSYVNGSWFLGDYRQDRLFISADTITWTEQTPIFSDEIMPMAQEGLYGAGIYMSLDSELGFRSVVGRGVSNDGVEWDELPEEVYGAAAFGNGEFKVVERELVHTSLDGITWTSESISSLPGYPGKLLYFKGRWLVDCSIWSAFGSSAVTMISNDCVNWVPFLVEIDGREFRVSVPDVVEMNGLLISSSIFSYGGGAVSLDGVNWTDLNFPDGVFNGFFLEEELVKLLPLGDRVLGVGPNQMSFISSPLGEPKETKDLKLLKPGFLEMAGVAGKEYRLLESASFEEDNWSAVGDWRSVTSDDPVLFWGANEDENRMFYRVEERTAE